VRGSWGGVLTKFEEGDREVVKIDETIQTNDVELGSNNIVEQLELEVAIEVEAINRFGDIIMDVH